MLHKKPIIKISKLLLTCLILNTGSLEALQGNQTITIYDLANYPQVTDVINPIDLSNSILTINSTYGLNNEPTTTFPGVFQGVGLALKPYKIVTVGNITAVWTASVNINSLDLHFTQGKFADIPVSSSFKGLGSAMDVLAQDTRYLNLVRSLRGSVSVADYQNKLTALLPMPSINDEVSHVQEMVIGKVEQRLVELDTKPLSYNAGSFFGNHLWFKPFVTFGKQDRAQFKNIQQYKSLVIGTSFGLDEINLSNTKASGVSISISKMKLYQYINNDKSDAYNFNALVYGKYVNKNLWFMQWIAGLGVSYANQKREINLSPINETAKSHHKWYVGSFQFSTGQQWQNEHILVKPGVGILYTYIHNEAYKENNAALTGLTIFPRDHHNVYAFTSIDLNNRLNNGISSFSINSYARAQYLLTSPKQSYFAKFINVDGSQFKSYSVFHRTHFKIGANIQYTRDDVLDGSIGVDYDFHKSFRSFTAYIRLGFIF